MDVPLGLNMTDDQKVTKEKLVFLKANCFRTCQMVRFRIIFPVLLLVVDTQAETLVPLKNKFCHKQNERLLLPRSQLTKRTCPEGMNLLMHVAPIVAAHVTEVKQEE